MAKGKNDVELMPEDTDNTVSDDEFGEIRVNFSDKEATSTALDFDALPSGKYVANIVSVKNERCGPDSKNPGKPMWNIRFVIQEGPHEGRSVFTRAMLFEGALYTTSQLLRATGHGDAIETGNIPAGHTLEGETVVLNVVKMRDTYREKRDGDGTEKFFKNEVKGIRSLNDAGSVTSGGSDSLLPG